MLSVQRTPSNSQPKTNWMPSNKRFILVVNEQSEMLPSIMIRQMQLKKQQNRTLSTTQSIGNLQNDLSINNASALYYTSSVRESKSVVFGQSSEKKLFSSSTNKNRKVVNQSQKRADQSIFKKELFTLKTQPTDQKNQSIYQKGQDDQLPTIKNSSYLSSPNTKTFNNAARGRHTLSLSDIHNYNLSQFIQSKSDTPVQVQSVEKIEETKQQRLNSQQPKPNQQKSQPQKLQSLQTSTASSPQQQRKSQVPQNQLQKLEIVFSQQSNQSNMKEQQPQNQSELNIKQQKNNVEEEKTSSPLFNVDISSSQGQTEEQFTQDQFSQSQQSYSQFVRNGGRNQQFEPLQTIHEVINCEDNSQEFKKLQQYSQNHLLNAAAIVFNQESNNRQENQPNRAGIQQKGEYLHHQKIEGHGEEEQKKCATVLQNDCQGSSYNLVKVNSNCFYQQQVRTNDQKLSESRESEIFDNQSKEQFSKLNIAESSFSQEAEEQADEITRRKGQIQKGNNLINNNSNSSSISNNNINIVNINNVPINQFINYNNFSKNNILSPQNINQQNNQQNPIQYLQEQQPQQNQQQQQEVRDGRSSSNVNTRQQMKQQNYIFYEGDETLYETYQLERFVAKSNSYVFEARNRYNNSLTECLKQVRISEKDFTKDHFINECKILEKTKEYPHPNMIKFFGYFITKENNDSQILIGNIVMERGKQSLQMYMKQRSSQFKKPSEDLSISVIADSLQKVPINQPEGDGMYFNEIEVVDFMKSMIDVHYHLQKQNIAHRDIKPQNILIVEDEDQNISYKVCDVGSGVGLEPTSQYTRTRTVIGTEAYMSPEVHAGTYTFNQQYNPFKSDVFSLGLVFLEFLTFNLVDKKLRQDKELYMAKIKELRHQAKERYKYIFGLNKILKQMLVYNQNDRVTFAELYQQVFEESRLTIFSSRQQQIERLSSSIFEEIMNKDNIFDMLEQSVISKVSSFRIELNSIPSGSVTDMFAKLKDTVRRTVLKKLYLSLDQTQLTHDQAKLLGEAISKAQSLVNLELSFFSCNLGEQGCINILQGISQCTCLKVLKVNLSNNFIGSAGINQGLQHLTNFSQLSELVLDLSQNQLGLECATAISEVLSGCQQIKKLELKLANNSITYKGVKHLQDSFEKLKTLQSLYLNVSQNQFFADQGFIQVGNLLEKIAQLRELTIVAQVNQIEGPGFEQLGESLQLMQNLDNNVTSLGLSQIEKGLTNKKRLSKVRLQLEGCGLDSEDMIYIGRILNIQQLKSVSLNLQHNKIDEKGALYIAAGLQQSKLIEEFNLNLGDSNIPGSNHLQIWKLLLQRNNVISMLYSARGNQLTDKTLDSIIAMIETLKKLKYFSLDLEANQFTDKVKKKFKLDMESYFRKNKVLELII